MVDFFAPNILSQIVIPYNVLSNFPKETKNESIECYNFNLDLYSFNQNDPLVIYFCLIDDEKNLRMELLLMAIDGKALLGYISWKMLILFDD